MVPAPAGVQWARAGSMAAAIVAVSCSADRTGVPSFPDRVHDPGVMDRTSSAFHGRTLREARWTPMLDPRDANACGRCHDGVAARPAGVTLAAPGAPACTNCHDQPGGVLACSTCHGSGTRSYPQGDAHAAHLNASSSHPAGFACSTCHPVPGDPVIGGLHGDGTVEIIFDPSVVRGEASYDRAGGSCAVSCHDKGGARPRPTWADTTPMRCGDCHGSPPAGHYPGVCNECHREANANGTALSGGPLHLNGTVDVGDGSGKCGACHGSGDSPWPSTGAHASHKNTTLTVPIPCSTCHVVPSSILDPGHLDGTVRVTFTGLDMARGAAPSWDGSHCSGVACHGANLADPAAVPNWADASGQQSKCGACHGIPPSQHTPSTSCNRADCHGSEVSLDVTGAPSITALGKALHIDGVVESAR
jgi:hypothetical protein